MSHAGTVPKPSILTFLHSFGPGGVERVALRLRGAWGERGVDSRLLIGRREGMVPGQDEPADYECPRSPGFSTAPFETLWMIGWLWRRLRRERVDALFCAGNTYTSVAVAMKLLLGGRCPLVIAKISNDLLRADLPWPVRSFYRLWCRMQGRLLDRVVALSPAMRDEVIAAMRIAPERVSVIANPVLSRAEFGALAQAGARARASRGPGRRFVAAGRLVAQKDFATLIRAFAQGADPDDRLTIVGDGPQRGRLERLAAALGVADRVRLPGSLPAPEHWLAEADVLLLSSRYEGLPGVVVEALAAGTPVIATDCCASMAELLGSEQLGTIVPVGNVAALARAIAAARPDAAGCAARQARAARHLVEDIADAYQRLLAPTRKSAKCQDDGERRYGRALAG